MRTYISNLIPKIQKYSQKLDDLTLLTNQHWVALDDISNVKSVYIFRSNNQLLISNNGKVTKASWEYLGHNALLIDRDSESFLFKHGFFDENVLALKVDGREEYAFLINESKFDGELDSLANVIEFLNDKYLLKVPKKSLKPSELLDHIEENIRNQKDDNFRIRMIDRGWGASIGKYLRAQIEFPQNETGNKIGTIFFSSKERTFFFKTYSGNEYYQDFNSCISQLSKHMNNKSYKRN